MDVMESRAEETAEDPLDREGGRPRTSAMGRLKAGEGERGVARRSEYDGATSPAGLSFVSRRAASWDQRRRLTAQQALKSGGSKNVWGVVRKDKKTKDKLAGPDSGNDCCHRQGTSWKLIRQ